MTEELVTFETAKLAREKGFDAVCGNLWMKTDAAPQEINAPKDEEMIGSFVALYIKYAGNPEAFMAKVSKMGKTHPLHNSGLPPVMFCRPTQDLLERWLREAHGIYPSVSPGIEMDSFNAVVSKVKEMAVISVQHETYELAREAALQHALKLLP